MYRAFFSFNFIASDLLWHYASSYFLGYKFILGDEFCFVKKLPLALPPSYSTTRNLKKGSLNLINRNYKIRL